MAAQSSAWRSVVVALTASLIGSLAQQQVALASGDDVQLFNEHAHLPARLDVHKFEKPSVYDPNLGTLPLADTTVAPKQSSAMGTLFHVYTRNKSTRNIKYRGKLNAHPYDLGQLRASDFDVTRPRTIVMIGGFLTGEEHEFQKRARDLWLKRFGSDVNVISVGWPDSNRPPYEGAVANTVLVARQITIFLHYLAQLGGTSLRDQKFLDSLHLIGHSLGAHIMGFVGKDLGGRVGRITGLDPAGPQFFVHSAERRLDRSDAQLVEALHTNAGEMANADTFLAHLVSDNGRLGPWFGIEKHVGHVDFWANDGRTQEGCADPLHLCDHGRAHSLYTDILEYQLAGLEPSGHSNRLWAFRADSYGQFESGANFEKFCPQLVDAQTHLSAAQVNKTLGQCAAPLLDLVTPTGELIRELRDEFHVSFDSKSAQADSTPAFYFKTRTNPERALRFVADQYLVKLYLNRAATSWDQKTCLLEAQLSMKDGAKVTLELHEFDRNQKIVSMPFAHPAGGEGAHAQLQELLAKAPASEALVRDLFPAELTLQYGIETSVTPRRISPVPSCKLAIQQVEVAPVSVYATNNVGALYAQAKESTGAALKFVSASEFSARVASDTLAQSNRYELKLDSVLTA